MREALQRSRLLHVSYEGVASVSVGRGVHQGFQGSRLLQVS